MTTGAQARAEALISASVGMRIEGAVRVRVKNGLNDAAASRGIGLDEYVNLARADGAVFQELLDRVTVQETSFFRDEPQFRLLARMLPIFGSAGTIWSAGCSNGQEAYSIAMILTEQGRTDWRVIATDISTKAVARTSAGAYDEREMAGVSPARKRQFFRKISSGWEIAPEVRRKVGVSRHSLAKDKLPFENGACPIVFCRNVLIYLRQQETHSLMRRLSKAMPAGGYLFLGKSESLWHMGALFEVENFDGCYVYRRPLDPGTAAGRGPLRIEPPPARVASPAVKSPEATRLPTRVAEAALVAGDPDEAVRLGRQAVFGSPDDPVSHWVLGVALETAGDARAARRSFSAARAAVERSASGEFGNVLEGYTVAAFLALLESKLEAAE